MTPHSILLAILLALAAALGLAGCSESTPPAKPDDKGAAGQAAQAPAKPVSILRPEAEPPREPEPLEPLDLVIGFERNERALSPQALAQLESLLDSDQFKALDRIIIGGHTDSKGSDEANLRASLKRAQAVADWLVEHGVAREAITVIAFGEQNPIAPNARPDGTPDEQGRARNRRVELRIIPRKGAVKGAPSQAQSESAPPSE